MISDTSQLPLWLKIGYTLFVGVLVPVYFKHYGPANFLWFSDIALLGMVPGLWAESPLIVSMMTLAVVLPEIVWNVDFFGRLLFGRAPFGLAGYMFDSRWSPFIRGLSLFHVGLPVVLVSALTQLGYDPRALSAQTVLGAIVLILSYLLTDPAENTNWVFGPGTKPQRWIAPPVYLAMVIVGFPLVIYWPTHLVLERLFVIAR